VSRLKSFVKECHGCHMYKRISTGNFCKKCSNKDPLLRYLEWEDRVAGRFPPKRVVFLPDPDVQALTSFIAFSLFVILAFSFKMLVLYLAFAFTCMGLIWIFKNVFRGKKND
jgi:hypothetical protein